jgi:uncharacterized protein YggU (UPF0235/DUF167 family)
MPAGQIMVTRCSPFVSSPEHGAREPGELRTLPSSRDGRSRVVMVWHVRARAVEGRANAALLRSVAEHVGVAASAVEIEHGERGREKVLRLRDCTVSAVVTALGAAPAR